MLGPRCAWAVFNTSENQEETFQLAGTDMVSFKNAILFSIYMFNQLGNSYNLSKSHVKCWNSSTYLKLDMEMICFKYLSFKTLCVCVCVNDKKRTGLNLSPVWFSHKHTMYVLINARWRHSRLLSNNYDSRVPRKNFSFFFKFKPFPIVFHLIQCR